MRRASIRFLLLLISLLLFGAACAGPAGPMLRVVNADTVTLDRVMLDAGGSSYALGRLLPGTAGQVVPVPRPDSQVEVRHHRGGPFLVRERFDQTTGVVIIQLVSDSVAGVRVERD